MDSLLSENQVVRLADGRSVTVTGVLGEGGQGVAYEVRVNETGEVKVLKWYKTRYLGEESSRFYHNIEENIRFRSPSPEFIWPEALTEWREGGSFGYLMEKYPRGYYDFSLYMTGVVNFESVEAMLNAAINIVSPFEKLHVEGCSYQDLNDSNFALEPSSGKVLICDNDNVVGQGQISGILGKMGYMAPELVRREPTYRNNSIPDKWTDRFSLAVILFILLVGDHPLEGKASVKSTVYDSFGVNPLFIFDKEDDRNRPVPGVHINATNMWNVFPTFVKNAFCKTFSKNSLTKNEYRRHRLDELEWLDILSWLKSSLFKCPMCDEILFVDSNTDSPDCTYHCYKCNASGRSRFYLRFIGRASTVINIPGFPGITVYSSVLWGNSVDINDKLIKIIHDNESIKLVNESRNSWNVVRADGRSVTIRPGEASYVYSGACIRFGGRRGDVAQIVRV